MHAQLLRLFVTVTLLQIPDYLCEHFFVALGGRCVHLRYVRREFVRMPCFEAGFDGRGGFRDGLGFEGGCSPFDTAGVGYALGARRNFHISVLLGLGWWM